MTPEDWEALMQDTPSAGNYGSKKRVVDLGEGGWDGHHKVSQSLHVSPVQDASEDNGFIHGVQLVPSREEAYHGMTAHRGVLSGNEYDLLDWELLECLLFQRLGSSREQIEELYDAVGPPSKERLSARADIDEKLLQIQEDGGNMAALALVFGWPLRENGECRKMSRALARAKANREEQA